MGILRYGKAETQKGDEVSYQDVRIFSVALTHRLNNTGYDYLYNQAMISKSEEEFVIDNLSFGSVTELQEFYRVNFLPMEILE